MKLFCAIVGEAESGFEMELNDSASVAALKNAIKGENDDIKCPARKLQLFLAKTASGKWLGLSEAGAASVALDRSGHLQCSNTNLMKMKGLQGLKDCVGTLPDQRQVHVLVLDPSMRRIGVDTGLVGFLLVRKASFPGSASKFKQKE